MAIRFISTRVYMMHQDAISRAPTDGNLVRPTSDDGRARFPRGWLCFLMQMVEYIIHTHVCGEKKQILRRDLSRAPFGGGFVDDKQASSLGSSTRTHVSLEA